MSKYNSLSGQKQQDMDANTLQGLQIYRVYRVSHQLKRVTARQRM